MSTAWWMKEDADISEHHSPQEALVEGGNTSLTLLVYKHTQHTEHSHESLPPAKPTMSV